MQLSRDDVAQIVREVWTSMLGLEADHLDVSATFAGPTMAGSVGVSGLTDCLISMEIDAEGARKFGATMFGMDVTEVTDDDVCDAVGELTNMVGGNIKSLLPEPSTLSLPVVAFGRNPTLKVVGGKVIMQTHFVSDDHPITVTVWQRPQS